MTEREKEMKKEYEEMLRKKIGNKIKLARSKTNFTQEELAEEISLSARYVSKLERGIAFGSASTIVNVCKALNISSDFLFNDLIQANSSEFINLIDNKFLENYYQLNEYNRKIINRLTSDLIKLQIEEDFKEDQSKKSI